MSCMDTSNARSLLSNNLECTRVIPTLSLKTVQLPVVNMSRTVKLEPVDDSSKHDCSIGSCSSTNMDSLKLRSVKRERTNNQSLETILQSSISLEKSDDLRSVKSEVVLERKQEACKSKDTNMVSIARIMQHQESCASSSALSVSLLHQDPFPVQLPNFPELTTSDFSCQSEQSFHSKSQHNDIPDELTAIPLRKDHNQSRPCKIGISSFEDQVKSELARIDEYMVEFCQNDAVASNVEEKMILSNEMLENEGESFGSESESQQNRAVGTICEKEDEEYEDGEVREHQQLSAEGNPIVDKKNTDNLEFVKFDSQNLQSAVPSADQGISPSVTMEIDTVKKDLDESHGPIKDHVSVRYESNNVDNALQESSEATDVVADEKRAISVPDKQPCLSGEDGNGSPKEELCIDIPTDVSRGNGVEIGGEATTKVSGVEVLTLPKLEASPNCQDTAKDSINAINKSRIINLSRPSVRAPLKENSFSNRLVTSRSGKERYTDFDGGFQPRGNRYDFYTGNINKFLKDRIHDQPVRNSRPAFMRGKDRASGCFGSLCVEWDPDRDFASESSYGPSDYRVIRRKHASSVFYLDVERNNCYSIPQDGTALCGNRRKAMDDEFPSPCRTSLRRLSSGDRDEPVTRGFQMLHRVPRNMSPRGCSGEAGSDVIGLRNDDKFIQHLSDNVINPGYSHPQVMYDEFDNQHVQGNRNFSNNLRRKGYPRIHSKSPVRSRTRSPGPWSSPRRRSPNGVPELVQHRSPAIYRMGRMRSPDQACFHDEMVARRHDMQHNNDLRDVNSGIHPRSVDTNRRSSPGRGFPRNSRRTDAFDSLEMGDGDEYLNAPSHSNKFHELHSDRSSIDDRRKFILRRGPPRLFRSDNEDFQFHLNDGSRPY